MGKENRLELNSFLFQDGRCVEAEKVFSRNYKLPYNFQIHPADRGKIFWFFTTPIIMELKGSSFVLSETLNFYVLRHPCIMKWYRPPEDRSILDCISFEEMRKLGEKARLPLLSNTAGGSNCSSEDDVIPSSSDPQLHQTSSDTEELDDDSQEDGESMISRQGGLIYDNSMNDDSQVSSVCERGGTTQREAAVSDDEDDDINYNADNESYSNLNCSEVLDHHEFIMQVAGKESGVGGDGGGDRQHLSAVHEKRDDNSSIDNEIIASSSSLSFRDVQLGESSGGGQDADSVAETDSVSSHRSGSPDLVDAIEDEGEEEQLSSDGDDDLEKERLIRVN